MNKLMSVFGLLIISMVAFAGTANATSVCRDVSVQERADARESLSQAGYELTPESFLQAWNEQDQDRINLYSKAGIADETNFLSTVLLAQDVENRVKLTKEAIDCGADVNTLHEIEDEMIISNSDRLKTMTPLMVAAAYGSPELVQVLIDARADLNEEEKKGRTPLILAARYNNNPEVLKVLVDAGADVNKRDKKGATPLMMAAAKNNNPAVVEALVEAGADVNEEAEKLGMTPLMLAAQVNNNPKVAEGLLEAGADVNEGGEKGVTPLMLAAGFNKNPEVLEVLLDAGADATAVSDSGATVMYYAEKNDDLQGTEVYDELKEKASK